MKILWIGDSADTGFGTVTTQIGKRLLAMGHDVRFINRNVLGGPAPGALAGRVWDAGYFNGQQLAGVLKHGFPGWKPDQAVLLADHQYARDVVSFDAIEDGKPASWSSLPVWHYVPIEGRELPPLWAKLWETVKPVAITKFGADEITKITGRPTPHIYHGVDMDTFYPVSRDRPIIGLDNDQPLYITSKADAKRHFGLNPDDIILLRTDRHMPRKNYNQMLRAIAPVLVDNVKCVVHCKSIDFGGSLHDTKSKLPETARSRVGFTEGHDTWRGMEPKVLATLYNAADIYLSNCSEGFGLALIEALACGVPVLGIDYSAVPEVVGEAGILVKAREIDNIYSHYWGEPTSDIAYATALREIIANREKYAARGPEQAAKFSWDDAAKGFDELFRSVGEEAVAA